MFKRNKHKQQEEENTESWLLPYSDLMTLLLAVFIVLFAVSKVDVEKAAQMSEKFRDAMLNESAAQGSKTETTNAGEITEEELMEYLEQEELEDLQKIKEEIDKELEEQGLGTSVTTTLEKRGLVISFNNAVLFESGSAAVKNQNIGALLTVAKTITTLDSFIRVEGHTDNVPIHSGVYPSNWELSSARAATVVRLFVSQNIPSDKIVAVGYGENRPVADNSTASGRAKNRRIDIIVLSEKYSSLGE
ncbi:MAG TPA: OmpA family protein [Clostridiales bacterium]|nr:OmpA family protein [Clostridiales bacterium]